VNTVLARHAGDGFPFQIVVACALHPQQITIKFERSVQVAHGNSYMIKLGSEHLAYS
jgi:hypothetical protein